MSTSIESVDASKIAFSWRAQYTSQQQNRMFAAGVPRGIHRGFAPVPSSTDLSLDLEPDPLSLDSAMVLREMGGADEGVLTYREEGTLTLDLSDFTGQTVAVGVKKSYTIGAATTVTWTAYTEAEVDDGTADEAVIVCLVDVPAVPGPLSTSDIDTVIMDSAWKTTTEHADDPEVLTQHDLGSVQTFYPGSTTGPSVGRSLAEAKFGDSSLLIDATASAGVVAATMLEHGRCSPGERVRVAIWMFMETGFLFGAGSSVVTVTFYKSAGTSAGAVTLDLTDLTTFDEWTMLQREIIVPAETVWVRLSMSVDCLMGGRMFLHAPQLFFPPRFSDKRGWKHKYSRVEAGVQAFTEVQFLNRSTPSDKVPFRFKKLGDNELWLTKENTAGGGSAWYIGSNNANETIDVEVRGVLSGLSLGWIDPLAFAKTYQCLKWFGTAFATRSMTGGGQLVLVNNGVDAPTAEIINDPAAQGTFYVPLDLPLCDVSAVTVLGRRDNAGCSLVVSLVRWSADDASPFVIDTFTFVDATGALVAENFPVIANLMPSPGDTYYLRVVMLNGGAINSVAVAALIVDASLTSVTTPMG